MLGWYVIIGFSVLEIAFGFFIHRDKIGTDIYFASIGSFFFYPVIISLIFGLYKWRKGKIWA